MKAIVTGTNAFLWTDKCYFVQAEAQMDENCTFMKMTTRYKCSQLQSLERFLINIRQQKHQIRGLGFFCTSVTFNDKKALNYTKHEYRNRIHLNLSIILQKKTLYILRKHDLPFFVIFNNILRAKYKTCLAIFI